MSIAICELESVLVIVIISMAGMCGKGTKYVTTDLTVFCSSLVESEPTCLNPEKIRFQVKRKRKVSLLCQY